MGAGAFVTLTSTALAQQWPSRPMTMVVPFAAGGSVDVMARIAANRISELLGQPIILENVPGAGGISGSARVAKAPPDGYQFVLGSVGTHAYSQTLSRKPLYSVVTDFIPVALLAESPILLVARNDLPVNNLQEFAAYAKSNQMKMQYGSSGAGSASHIPCVLLNSLMGVSITHVPYRSSPLATQDMLAGIVDYQCPTIAATIGQIDGRQIKPIAMFTRERSPLLPSLATAHEQGIAIEATNWYALFLPKGTPDAIVQKLHSAVLTALDTPAVAARFREAAATVVAPERRSTDYLAKFVASEIATWAGPIRASGALTD
jgi:tripartite-type tricarboxylate transporter receptor subunit TctC